MTHHAFRDIRALRAAPPLAAEDPERRAVFSASLQQSEELFAAAAVAGPAAKPLPLFYALSQAGRAIAGAQYPRHDGWRIQGHGLNARTNSSVNVGQTMVTARPTKDLRDAPSVVAAALDSAPLAGTMTISQLVAALPEIPARRLHRDAVRALVIEPQDDSPWASILPGAQGTIRLKLDSPEELPYALSDYAGLQGYEVVVPPSIDEYGTATVLVSWPAAPDARATPSRRTVRHMSDIAVQVNDRWYLQPKLGSCKAAPDRLLIWWALLYALSHLARYQPAEWVAALDVDNSLDAVDIEDTLRTAETTLPDLIAGALGTPGHPPRALMRRGVEQRLAEFEQRAGGPEPPPPTNG